MSLLIALSVILSPVALAANILWEYINTGGDSDSANITNSQWSAQIFTTNSTTAHTISSVRVPLKRTGTTPGTVTLSIRETVGTAPNGIDKATATYNGNNISTSYSWYEFTLNETLNLKANTAYAIIVRAENGDASNYINWYADAGGDGVATSYASNSTTGGVTWGSAAPTDYLFEVYGDYCMSIQSVQIFSTYAVANDWIVVAEITNTYPPYYPNDDPSRYFRVRLMDGATVLAENTLVAWDRQPISIYLNPTKTATLDWGNATTYKVQMCYYTGTPYVDYALTTSNWRGDDLFFLDQWVRITAVDLQDYYGTTLLVNITDRGLVLNDTGGTMFANGIAALTSIRPDLFENTSSAPTYTNATWTKAGENSTTWQAQVGPEITAMLGTWSDTMGMPAKTLAQMLVFAIFFVVAFLSFAKGYAWAGTVAALPILIVAGYFRIISLTVIAVIASIALLLLIREFIWKGG